MKITMEISINQNYIEDSNHPKVDLKITDTKTGKSLGIQLKVSENKKLYRDHS